MVQEKVLITVEERQILNKLIDNSDFFPRYEIKIKAERNNLYHFYCHTFEDAEICANILLKIPNRKQAIISYFKNEYNCEIKEVIKLKLS